MTRTAVRLAGVAPHGADEFFGCPVKGYRRPGIEIMSDSSELGAIDPQVDLPDSNGHVQTSSAQSYLDAFQTHADNLKKNPHDPIGRLMLDKMEPATVRKLERITTRSRAIAEDLLKQAMVKDEGQAIGCGSGHLCWCF